MPVTREFGDIAVPNKDLRNWITEIEAAGQLKIIRGAEPKQEIGGILDIYQRRMGNPAVMFDEVPGFPKGHRVLANILTSVPRHQRIKSISEPWGGRPSAMLMRGTEVRMLASTRWRGYMKDASTHKPRE